MTKMRDLKVADTDYKIPVAWSDNAGEIFARKYCRKSQGAFTETLASQVFYRLVNFWKIDETETFDDLWYQRAAPNSPQFFNGGIFHMYGVRGGNIGLYDLFGNPLTDTFSRPQLHACFIQPVVDSLKGILDLLGKEARLFSRGSGTGTNFSTLRGKGEKLSQGGTSSGLISFLKVFDAMAGTIKSGGTTRRAAKMVVVDIDHPDVSEFIWWKVNEDRKAKALATEGFGHDWQSESYKSVSGQNANNSIRVTDDFMSRLELPKGHKKRTWSLKARRDKDFYRFIDVSELWQQICHAAWHCADPGLQFSDTINRWNTTPSSGEIRASNPCAEHLRLDNSACNLASINLYAFYRPHDKVFIVDRFIETVERWTKILDRSIDLAGYPSYDIAVTTQKCRDIGLGYCNLGWLLMELGIPYDSEHGRTLASLLTSLMTATAYRTSASLAKQHGKYACYEAKRHTAIVDNHFQALSSSLKGKYTTGSKHIDKLIDQLIPLACGQWERASLETKQHGLRNAQLTVIAPTGTIGITMDCKTTGIEPVFSHDVQKVLAGGGKLKQSTEITTNHFDPVYATAVGDNALTPQAHIDMLAAVQPHVSGGISKTVNLPNSATVDDISDLFKLAHSKGVKCISVYRDGCKSQPLTTDKLGDCKECGDDEACEIA